jgi:outer membrane assembly lipoprotein YfiO
MGRSGIMSDGRALLLGMGLVLSGCLSAPSVRESPDVTAEDRLAAARQSLGKGENGAALRSARWAFIIAGDDAARGEALFLEGEALFHQGEYSAAHDVYRRILDEHSGHPRFRDAVGREHEIGTLLLKGEDPGRFLWFSVSREDEGVEILQRIVTEFPAERFAEDSQFRIATYHFAEEEYEEAQEAYQRLYLDFPASKWAAISLFRAAECLLLRSRGPRYDPTPLEEARSVFREYIRKYPRGDKVKEAEAEIARIEETQAFEEYVVARSYLRDGKSRSAEVYLRSIILNYPDTPTADVARETLRGMGLPVPGGSG